MDKTYFIYLSVNGNRCYILQGDDNEPISVMENAITANIRMFNSFSAAKRFISENEDRLQGFRAYIVTAESVIRMGERGLVASTTEMYYVETPDGMKLCPDGNGNFYFDNKDVGFCCWATESLARRHMNALNVPLKWSVKKLSGLKK